MLILTIFYVSFKKKLVNIIYLITISWFISYFLTKGGQLSNLNRWLRPYNVQEILCAQCHSTVPSANTSEVPISSVKSIASNAIRYDGKVKN